MTLTLDFLDRAQIGTYASEVSNRILEAGRAGKLILVGSALLPQKCFRALQSAGAAPIAFIEYDPRFWGRTVEGVPVLSPDAAIEKFGPDLVCISGIWSPNHCYAETREWLKAFGFLEIYPVASVFWTVAEIIGSHYQLAPPHIFAERRADAEKIFSSLGDEQSRTYFAGNLRWRVTLDPSTLPAGDRRHAYFDPRLFDLGDRPVIVDVGAFDGDSLRSFLLWHGSNFGKFFAIEPDPISFERLKAYLESLPDMVRSRITALPLAAADTAGMLQLAASGKPGSGGDNGAALIDVRCARLDNEFSDQMRIDYLKFDIEGAEAAALEGAWALIERHHPVVGIAAYHKPTDIIDIPLAFIERFPNWSYYFRAHDQDGIDFVFYAVSPSRQIMI